MATALDLEALRQSVAAAREDHRLSIEAFQELSTGFLPRRLTGAVADARDI